ncbi:uncharacterized protein LOC132638150 [Lycium barbarum]|uniref:uncharacterized protein LOC132638150 n=1 Tax=Lycium barbarum TaxID=112863 RepID=UPI00293E210C|nr:uncharacterized protein LOC132638150 [Lycium barbarum]
MQHKSWICSSCRIASIATWTKISSIKKFLAINGHFYFNWGTCRCATSPETNMVADLLAEYGRKSMRPDMERNNPYVFVTTTLDRDVCGTVSYGSVPLCMSMDEP